MEGIIERNIVCTYLTFYYLSPILGGRFQKTKLIAIKSVLKKGMVENGLFT